MKSEKYALALCQNPQPRCPVHLLVDCSTSMEGKPIEELHHGIDQFFHEVDKDPFARLSVEATVIAFGLQVRALVSNHSMADGNFPSLPRLEATGSTPMGGALSKALGMIRGQRTTYRKNGVSSYKPWIVLLTDGEPNDDWEEPAREAREMAARNQLVFFGIGLGPFVNLPLLSEILPENCPPAKLKGLRFAAFFRWLSDSLGAQSRDSVDSSTQLPPMDEWAEGDWDWEA